MGFAKLFLMALHSRLVLLVLRRLLVLQFVLELAVDVRGVDAAHEEPNLGEHILEFLLGEAHKRIGERGVVVGSATALCGDDVFVEPDNASALAGEEPLRR